MFKFRRWITILDSRNKDEINRAEDRLKNAGLRIKTWASEPMPVGGCGAQMRPANWSGIKPAVRPRNEMLYHLAVTADEEEHARKLLKSSNEKGDSHDLSL